MNDEPERWDAGLTGLLDAERQNVRAPEGAEDRVWAKLGAGFLPPGGGGSGPGTAAARAAAPAGRAVTYLLGVASGVVGTALVMHAMAGRAAPAPSADRAIAAAHAADPVEHEVVAPALIASLSATADANVPLAPRAVAASPSSARAVASAAVDRPLEAERLLLDDARAALGRSDGESALRATAAHAQRYPQGLLAEEREAIAIQALLLVSRFDDAREREAAFERQYPHSMLLQAVRASVRSIP